MMQLGTFVANVSSQIEVATSISIKEMRGVVDAIHDGVGADPGD
ncbi:hypothetical protein [Bradyrhizobium xenonodulans]|nr:hypothetical protein [Bradyrhizobium xenonodulans]